MLFVVMLRRLSLSVLALAVSAAGLAQPSDAAKPASMAQSSLTQPPSAKSSIQPVAAIVPPSISETVSVGYVMIPFTVLGEQNRPLTDLQSSEVDLLIDGTRVRSDMFE